MVTYKEEHLIKERGKGAYIDLNLQRKKFHMWLGISGIATYYGVLEKYGLYYNYIGLSWYN